METQLREEWLHSYAVLALRIDRHLAATGAGRNLIYTGPDAWRADVEAEALVEPLQLVDDCDGLRETIPFDGDRATRLDAQLKAMRAVARRLTGADVTFTEYAGECLGVSVEQEPDDTFAAAHDRLAVALPPGAGTLADRLHAWQRAHHLPAEGVADAAWRTVAECIARTRRIVRLPDELEIDVQLAPGPNRGHYAGGNRGTVYLADNQPVNGADLVYIIAHEAFPGHIAESLLKHSGAADEPERAVRFMLSPAFVVSEGLGLHAQEIAFGNADAQRWLTDHILSPLGIASVGGDFAAIHDARNALWGAWGTAAIMAAEDRPESEIADYLRRWALLTDDETAWALAYVRTPGAGLYVQGYFHGWRLLRSWLDHPNRLERVRRLLTEPLLPRDLL